MRPEGVTRMKPAANRNRQRAPMMRCSSAFQTVFVRPQAWVRLENQPRIYFGHRICDRRAAARLGNCIRRQIDAGKRAKRLIDSNEIDVLARGYVGLQRSAEALRESA